MNAAVTVALRERLGYQATKGLVDFVEDAGREWQEGVLNAATERFGRTLAEETAKFRVELATECGKLRAEMAEGLGQVRAEMADGLGKVRAEMADGLGKVRTEMTEGLAGVRVEMANLRVDVLKWAFLFWVGQLAAVAGLLAVMLRR